MQASQTQVPRTRDLPMEWGVLGPSGRVWVFDERSSDGSLVNQRERCESFATGTGMPLVHRAPGGDWTQATR